MPSSRISHLDQYNYSHWLTDARARLRTEGLWKYTEKCPEFLTPEAVKRWEEGAMKAADLMTLTISSPIKAKLHKEDFDDANKMMTRLASQFRPTGDAEFMRLNKELYSVKFDQFGSASKFFTHIKALQERISHTGVQMTEDKQCLLIYSSTLPGEYQPLVKLWAVTPDMTGKSLDRHTG